MANSNTHQIRRGPSTDAQNFSGAVGEWFYNTTTGQLNVCDGATPGAFPVQSASDQVSTVSTSVLLTTALFVNNSTTALTVTLPDVTLYPMGQRLFVLGTNAAITFAAASTVQGIWVSSASFSTSLALSSGLGQGLWANGSSAWIFG